MRGTVSKKRRSFHWFSRNSELEATWVSLISWPHKMSNKYVVSVYLVMQYFVNYIRFYVRCKIEKSNWLSIILNPEPFKFFRLSGAPTIYTFNIFFAHWSKLTLIPFLIWRTFDHSRRWDPDSNPLEGMVLGHFELTMAHHFDLYHSCIQWRLVNFP